MSHHGQHKKQRNYGKRICMEAPQRPTEGHNEARDREKGTEKQTAVHLRRTLHHSIHQKATLRRGRTRTLHILIENNKAPRFLPRSFESCGENRIRTCEPVLPVTRFPGVPLQPLEHLSFFCATKVRIKFESQKLFSHFRSFGGIFLVH